MRCRDLFYGAFLDQCRNGALERDPYFFIHGVPTESSGSIVPGETQPRCGRDACSSLHLRWRQMFLGGATWKEMLALECPVFSTERLARSRVAWTTDDPRLQLPPLDTAPYVHPFNMPKYAALQQRAPPMSRRRPPQNTGRTCVHTNATQHHTFPASDAGSTNGR